MTASLGPLPANRGGGAEEIRILEICCTRGAAFSTCAIFGATLERARIRCSRVSRSKRIRRSASSYLASSVSISVIFERSPVIKFSSVLFMVAPISSRSVVSRIKANFAKHVKFHSRSVLEHGQRRSLLPLFRDLFRDWPVRSSAFTRALCGGTPPKGGTPNEALVSHLCLRAASSAAHSCTPSFPTHSAVSARAGSPSAP